MMDTASDPDFDKEQAEGDREDEREQQKLPPRGEAKKEDEPPR